MAPSFKDKIWQVKYPKPEPRPNSTAKHSVVITNLSWKIFVELCFHWKFEDKESNNFFFKEHRILGHTNIAYKNIYIIRMWKLKSKIIKRSILESSSFIYVCVNAYTGDLKYFWSKQENSIAYLLTKFWKKKKYFCFLNCCIWKINHKKEVCFLSLFNLSLFLLYCW